MKRSFGIYTGLAALSVMAAAFVGCGSDDGSGSDPGATGGTDNVPGSGGAAGMAGMGGGSADRAEGSSGTAGAGGEGTAGSTGGGVSGQTRMTISGEATWNVSFDADAQSAGATNCAYTRRYEGVQDQSRPWVCPQCEVVFRTTVQISAGLDDCYAQVSETEPMDEEWVGYADGTWYRSYGIGASDQGSVTVENDAVTLENEVTDLEADLVGTGMMGFAIEGSFTLAQEDGDPNHGWVAADQYSCGWNKADPPAYTGDYTLEKGGTLPDGLFRDKCDEVFRIHDYKGSYIVVFMSAMDCSACRQMAAQESAWIEKMAGMGVDVATITVMAPSLNDPFGETSLSQLEYWSTQYDIHTPVVSDRGWGPAMFLPIFLDQLGTPSWVVADPDLNVLQYGAGVDWGSIENAIRTDAL